MEAPSLLAPRTRASAGTLARELEPDAAALKSRRAACRAFIDIVAMGT